MMPVDSRTEDFRSEALSGSEAEKVRAGVTGHNVRYVLGFSLVGALFAFAVVAYLYGQGWLGVH
jgi:hypothetical protein